MTRELRVREGTLHQRAQELERSNRDLAQFASVASHDLKTPLRSVKGYVDLLSRRYHGRLDADADEFLAFASDGTVRMEALIDDLLAYAAVGSTPADCAPVDLDAVARQAVLALRRQIREAGAEIRLDGLPTVPGDERQLGQLIGNLLTNALKFTDPARSPVITVTADRVDDAWRIDVTDNGIGVADHDAERIFAMFGRLHSADAFPGTGIGWRSANASSRTMAARSICGQHGPGRVFSFTLPVGVAVGMSVPSPR
jgi:light-regulated signal transduction histidine kinase (bacteriophytochrome)